MFSRQGPEPEALREEVEAFGKLGITWTALSLPAPSRAGWCEAVAALGSALRA